MKKMRNLKKLLYVALPLMVLAILASCKKKDSVDDPRKNYPKDVQIEYRVTAVSGNPGLVNISYNNETGADTRLSDQPLPFVKKISKKVTYGEVLLLGTSGNIQFTGSIKLEILVDGKSVTSETPQFGNTYANASITHSFDK